MVVVQLAKASNLLFGGTANYLVARELSNLATYDQKLALMRCLFRPVGDRRGDLDGRGRGDPPHRERASHRSSGPGGAASGASAAPAGPVRRLTRGAIPGRSPLNDRA